MKKNEKERTKNKEICALTSKSIRVLDNLSKGIKSLSTVKDATHQVENNQHIRRLAPKIGYGLHTHTHTLPVLP